MMAGTVYEKFKRPRLGEILLDRKLVNRKQLDEALSSQKKERDFVGNTLIKMGFISERDVMVALGIQCHLPYIAIDKCQVNRSVMSLIPKEFAQRHHVVPLDKVGNVLSLVTDKPLDADLRDEIKAMTQHEIAFFVATRTEIDRAISLCYD